MKGPLVGAWVAVGLATAAPPLAAQGSFASICQDPAVEVVGARDACLAAAQSAAAVQPAIGLLMSAGSPTTGAAAGGLRLGLIPRVSTGVRVNLVRIDLPDIVADQIPGGVGSFIRDYGFMIPALSADMSVALTEGFEIAPGIGGLGAVSLLLGASYLPLEVFDDNFDDSDFAYALGARVYLLTESFLTPDISVALTRRALSSVAFGDVCPGAPTTGPQTGECMVPGDAGEITFDLVNWSGRAIVSKHLFGVGATAGLGYDRYDSDLGYGFRAPAPVGTDGTPFFRVSDENLNSSRWAVFGGLSYNVLVASIATEVGWQQGAAPISGFGDLATNFDSRDGTWFGSLGVRIGL